MLGRTYAQLVHQVREWYSGAAAKVGVFFALPALWIGLRIVLLASAEIEVRQLFELEDFGPSEAMKRFRDMGVATKK